MSQPNQSFELGPLHPMFSAVVQGLDLSRALPAEVFSRLLAAFDEHSLLLFREQRLDSAAQVLSLIHI